MNNAEQNITEYFFKYLGQRLNKENSLSDVTWVMCMASEYFRNEFLSFFFGDVDFKDAEIKREVSEGDARPDFTIVLPNGIIYLIEVKIYDKNQHFWQYIKTHKIPCKRLGYITNYKYNEPGFVVHQWCELVEYLSVRIPKSENNIWTGYLDYVRQVCNLITYTKPMNIDGLHSIFELNQALSEVCVYDAVNYRTSFNNYQRKIQQGEFGVYFDFEFRGTNNGKFTHGGGAFVVKFDHEEPSLNIYFNAKGEWYGPVYDRLIGCIPSIRATKLCNKPYDDGYRIMFEFAAMEEFEELDNYEGQRHLLGRFFREVIDKIYRTTLEKK